MNTPSNKNAGVIARLIILLMSPNKAVILDMTKFHSLLDE
jgi:hypothetical protein